MTRLPGPNHTIPTFKSSSRVYYTAECAVDCRGEKLQMLEEKVYIVVDWVGWVGWVTDWPYNTYENWGFR